MSIFDKIKESEKKVEEKTEEMGSPIKGPVKRKNTSPYKKIHLFFACPLTFAPVQPRFIVTFFRSRYFFHIGS